MPKKTRPGGRYTTRVNRDGSQQYGRRGCMVLMIGMLALPLGSALLCLGGW